MRGMNKGLILAFILILFGTMYMALSFYPQKYDIRYFEGIKRMGENVTPVNPIPKVLTEGRWYVKAYYKPNTNIWTRLEVIDANGNVVSTIFNEH